MRPHILLEWFRVGALTPVSGGPYLCYLPNRSEGRFALLSFGWESGAPTWRDRNKVVVETPTAWARVEERQVCAALELEA